MLTREENELLTRTGPGMPMGRLMRRYWIPALLSRELPKPDCPPVRLKLLGEKLVAFRDSNGKAGMFDPRCPHRGADLFFGRNEEAGLRCVYHGWKFDVDGMCVDMPSEPAESNFKNKVRVTAYPCEERGGVIWTYMGPPESKPGFPGFEWTGVPESQRFVTRRLQESNWLQGYEGGWDTAHLPFLHQGDTQQKDGFFTRKGSEAAKDLPNVAEFVATDYGFVYGIAREVPEGLFWECALMCMPTWKMFQPFKGNHHRISILAWMPVDDENCMLWAIEYHYDRPLEDEEMARSRGFGYIHVEADPKTLRPHRNRDNDYLIDRERQASGASFTGMRGVGLQDSAIQESMGPIADRTREHLGTSDREIIQLRRQLLKILKDHEAGAPPLGVEASSYRVRPWQFTVPAARPLADAAQEFLRIDPPVLAK
jgi:phthalate 4,5-dioxygenase oxygenase subunit